MEHFLFSDYSFVMTVLTYSKKHPMRRKVVILSDQSLLPEGIASRFQQYPERVELHFVHPRDEDRFDQIEVIQPDAVIVNSSDNDMKGKCSICELILTFPAIKIIRLAVDKDPVLTISSQQSQLNEVGDLLDLL